MRELLDRDSFVPNDIYLCSQSNFQLISGCNMAGKSTYLRQIALIMIMAQIGCYVPADYASICIVHELFFLVADDHSLDQIGSSFAMEMRDVAYMLNSASATSLCIIDELGRGTSNVDGVAINLALCEQLISNPGMKVYSTHFWQISQVLKDKSQVICHHLEAEINEYQRTLSYRHNLTKGFSSIKHYALLLARSTSLPTALIQEAVRTSESMSAVVTKKNKDSRIAGMFRVRKALLRLRENLLQSSNGTDRCEVDAIRSWLESLHINLLADLEARNSEYL